MPFDRDIHVVPSNTVLHKSTGSPMQKFGDWKPLFTAMSSMTKSQWLLL